MFKLLTSDQWNKENYLRHTPGKRILRQRPQCRLVSFPRGCRNEDANQMCTLQKCGTDSTGWLDGYHPTVADGKVRRTVCFRDRTDCCKHPFYIKVRNCGYFYVYQLTSRTSCNQRYCSTD